MPLLTTKHHDLNIPIIDIASDHAAIEVLDAAKRHGFIYVKNKNEIATRAIDGMFDISRDFFAAPKAVKAETTINSKSSGKNHGWLPMNMETLDPGKQKKGDCKEAFNFGEFSTEGNAQQPLPVPLRPHEAEIGSFLDECHGLCNRVLRLLALGLQISKVEGGVNWFFKRHDKRMGASGSVLRLLYYPALMSQSLESSEDIRAGAHSDYGSVTLLFRLPSQPGLEIRTAAGDWEPVPVRPEGSSEDEPLPILVNIGDLLSYWTNGLLQSTVHRVVFPAQGAEDRYSIAYFCHPQDDAKLVPVPSEMVRGLELTNGASEKVLTARDHLNARLAATYGI